MFYVFEVPVYFICAKNVPIKKIHINLPLHKPVSQIVQVSSFL